ncbi:hypothetical protein FRC08_017623 [Ceratobasidium sp. 394]|nr:hypothetical protein FRC08_017623 [Ceratobasidium sp. 394]
MPRSCSPVTRARIVDLMDAGQSTHSVAKQVGRAPSTVSKMYKRYKSGELDFYHDRPRSGRPKKLTPSDLRFIASLVARGKVENAVQVQKEYFPGVSAEVVRRALRQAEGGSGSGAKGKVDRKSRKPKNGSK